MKILLFLFLILAAPSSIAEEKLRSIWAVAVGEPPVAKLKVVEEYGFRGYRPEELESDLLFPTNWSLTGGGASQDFVLKLNHPATRLEVPLGASSVQLGCAEHPNLTSVSLPEEPALIVIFNPTPKESWKSGTRVMVIPLQRRGGTVLETTLVNLASVPLHYLSAAGKPTALTPLKTIRTRVPQDSSTGVSSLPLLAKTKSHEARLVVTEFRGSSDWNPVTLVTPVFNAARPRLRSLVLYLQE